MSSRRRRFRRPVALLALLTAALAVAVAFSTTASSPPATGAVAIEAVPVPLDEADASRERVGALLYRGGLWLRSQDRRFGGLSDLRLSPDGTRLFAVSDCGEGLTATLSYDAEGRLAGAGDVRVVSLASQRRSPGGSDAESLVLLGDRLEVGFEGRARLLAYRADPSFGGPPRVLPLPGDVGLCHSNGGLETMADIGGGRRLLVCEKRRSASNTVSAWIGAPGKWSEREYQLAFEGGWAGEPFRPTGATRLPDGDVLVLERRFPPLAARVVRLAASSLEGTGPLAPAEVARFEGPLTLDNFEGIEARRDDSGRTLVYLLSDDNNCLKNAFGPIRQRTLLLMFALQG
jgi:hypothetical protein